MNYGCSVEEAGDTLGSSKLLTVRGDETANYIDTQLICPSNPFNIMVPTTGFSCRGHDGRSLNATLLLVAVVIEGNPEYRVVVDSDCSTRDRNENL